MNILKIQDQLKGVPDQTLVGYVQNPTGQVPTYLALSELQRRKEMRQNYQANKPEDKTVAEDLVQETQPGLASLPAGQPMQQAMQPPPEMPMEQMAQGGVAELDTGNMYDENNYANGGIVAFAKGGMPDEYGVTMPIVPTMDDMVMQTQEAQKAFGVDPEFYSKALAESKTERLKELEAAKNMDQAQLLLAMGSAFASTPGFGKALGVAGEKAAPIVGAMGKNQREINSLYKMADRKTLEAQYAQARGDAQGAQKAITDKENLLLNAQLKEAELNSKKAIADAKAKADAAKGTLSLRDRAAKLGEQMFTNAYPAGSVSNILGDDPGFVQFVRNLYLKNAENYLKTETMPPIPTESQMRKMYENYKNKSVTDKTSSATQKDNKTASATDVKRPPAIDAIFKKHENSPNASIFNQANAAPNKKLYTTNTQDELDTDWDSAGPHEPEDDEAQ